MKNAIFVLALLATGTAQAHEAGETTGPGATAESGAMGAGTVNPRPATPPATNPMSDPAGRDQPDDTVAAAVDRTVTTATTGAPVPFASVDKDDNGLVDWQEGEVLRNTGHDFKAADGDRDGYLSASEYQRMVGSRTP